MCYFTITVRHNIIVLICLSAFLNIPYKINHIKKKKKKFKVEIEKVREAGLHSFCVGRHIRKCPRGHNIIYLYKNSDLNK